MAPLPNDPRELPEALQPDYELEHPGFALMCGGFLLLTAIGCIVAGVVTGGLW